MSGSTTAKGGRDTYVSATSPNSNFQGTTNLQLGHDGSGGPNAFAYIYFQNPAPRGATIKQAVLRLFTRDSWGTAQRTIEVNRLAEKTTFSRVTWNTRPSVVPRTSNPITVTQASPAPFTLWEINVAPLLQQIANGAKWYGFRLAMEAETTRRLVVSLNNGTHRPSLFVEWSDAPQAPTNLVPAGGQAVSLQNPVLSWDYVDVGGNTELAAFQVQIAGDNQNPPDWTSTSGPAGIHFDTLATPADEAEWDTNDTTPGGHWGGLQPDMIRYWRVRVQDGAGLWSRWSHRAVNTGAKMVRRQKGALALLSPTGGFVDDFTPTIIWTFGIPDQDHPARDQKHWRILLVNPDDPTEWYWHSGMKRGDTGPDNRFERTLPRGALTRWGKRYRLQVDVWDFQDRVATPHDPPWVRVSHDFTLRDTAGMQTRPTNLAGTSDVDGRPYMHLSWRAANTPDFWRVFRGDTLITPDEIPGADLLTTTPGLYRFVDKDAAPNQTHTWAVRAVEINPAPGVERQTSQPATWTGRVHTDHAWLVDWDSDRIVAILDPDVSFEMPDLSATYEPVASDHVVRVSGVQRGMQGTVAGRLTGFPDGNQNNQLQVWHDNFIWMKAHPGRDYRLMAGNRTWRVRIGDAVISPMRIRDSQAEDISFSFWSMGGPPTP